MQKENSAPSDSPIQFFCIDITLSGHNLLISSRSFNSSDAYKDVFKNHWEIFFFSTSAPDLHPLPSITCSFARTVLSTGSQLTKDSFL